MIASREPMKGYAEGAGGGSGRFVALAKSTTLSRPTNERGTNDGISDGGFELRAT